VESVAQLSARAPRLAHRALILIILAACVLATGSWRVYSNTWDEPEHLAAGVELLDRGKYEYDTEHPPLGRLFLAIGPYLAGARSFGTPPPEGTPEGLHILYSKGAYWRDLTLARLGMLPFLVLLLYATWLWARRLLPSEGAALLAVVLTVSVPPILGHAALASLDVAAASTTLLALYALQRWLASARLRDAVFFGLASGVAVVTKFSAVPFIGIALIVLSLTHWAVPLADPPHWRAWPDYLPYFNEWVAHPERVLVDSDLDWGQDLHRLEVRAAQLHIGHLSLAYRGTADLRREPLPPVHILAPHERATGWIAVSQLARTRNLSDYGWLDDYEPVERVGKTIDLYYLP